MKHPSAIVSSQGNPIIAASSLLPATRKSQSAFEQLITSSIMKINQSYRIEQLQEFNELLSKYIELMYKDQQQPRKIKQLNIDPYIFVLQYLFGKEELVCFGLRQLNVIIDQNYYSKSSLHCIITLLGKCVQKHSSECVGIVLKIKQPSIELFELFFEIYSTILLPEEIALKFRLLGYQWIIRIFRMKETTIPLYFKHIIDKIGVFELPPLISTVQQEKQLQTYIHKIVNNLISKVQDRVQLQLGSQAIVYRRRRKGKYLYCFMCQKPADYYCKDTKVPVCSSQCKKEHLLYIQSVSVVNEQFSQQYLHSVEQLLLGNWYCARSPSLSVDYLIAIYTFSLYKPQSEIHHHRIVRSPIMIQKVWLLYSSYYEKKGELFQHVFMSFLLSNNQYLHQVGKYYFLEISQTHRILEIYYNYDLKGNMRLFPMLFKVMLDDRDYCSIFITNLVEIIFQNINSQYYFRVTPNDVTLSSTLLELFNEAEMPIQSLEKYFPEDVEGMLTTDEQIALFLMKNQTLIKKQRLTRLLDKDQQFTKSFLRQLTLKRAHSPIDQLLRQVFYFINVNVSEKIYRLLELLYEVYEFESLGDEGERRVMKKDDALFQYMYVVVMINTELHSPNVQKKPTLGDVVERVAVINKPLASEQAHKNILESMYQRLKSLPFSQQTRGVLQHYQPYAFKMFKLQEFYLPLIILQNHQPIYETFVGAFMPNAIIYRICNILTGFPEVEGVFFRLMLERLQKQQLQDEYLLQAIRNILQQQPNAVNIQGGWRIVFNYIKDADSKRRKLQRLTSSSGSVGSLGDSSRRMDDSVTSPTLSSVEGDKRRRRIFQPFNPLSRSSLNELSGHTMIWLDLQSVIVASPLLTHDNFICFFKDFASTFPIQTYFKQYQKAIYLNRKRLNSMANGLMMGFRKMENYWMGMKMMEYIAGLQEVQMQCESNKVGELAESRILVSKITTTTMSKIKSQLILLMLKQLPITDTTQPLLLSTILSLANTTNFMITSQLWQCMTHLALKFKSQENQSIVEQLMKRCGQCEECYESLMIQKTLNSTQPQLINRDVLTRLDKLEPYLNDLQEKVLKMFILKQNLPVIQKNISRFSSFVQTFTLFKQHIQKITNISQIAHFIVQRIQQVIQHQLHLQSLLSQQFVDFMLAVFQMIGYEDSSFSSVFIRYCDYLSLCVSVGSFEEKTMLDRSVIFYQASKQLYLLAVKVKDRIRKQSMKEVRWVVEPMHMLTQFCQKLNANVDYRRTLSQTYTFKHIVQFHQQQTHSPYLIGLTKQFISCKQLIWTIKQSHPQIIIQAMDFLSTQIRKLALLYETTQSEVEDFDKCLSQILDQKTLDEIFVKLREKVIGFRAYLGFVLGVMVEFSGMEIKEEAIEEKVKAVWDLYKDLLIKLLFNGVFVVEVRHPISKFTQKKLHPPHQTIKSQPFSNYLQNLGQNQQPLKNLTQKIIKSGALSK